MWDAATGQALATLSRHQDDVNMASFSPDGKRLLTASDDHTARIYAVDLDSMMSLAMKLLPRDVK